MFLGVDHQGLGFAAAANVGDDFTATLILVDFTTGPVSGVGATILATVGGENMAVDYSITGLYILTLSDTQTTALGTGPYPWLFRHTPAGGPTQSYVRGTVKFSTRASDVGSSGWQAGIVHNTLVGIA